MKKLFTLIIAAATVSFAFNSCSLNGDGASATMNYFGTCDTIVYSDSLNAPLDTFIKVGIATLGCTATPFEETASVPESMMEFAIAKCNDQAIETWKTKVNKLTLSDISNAVFKEFSDTLSSMGIHKASDLNLKTFKVKTKLYNVQYTLTPLDYLITYDREVK